MGNQEETTRFAWFGSVAVVVAAVVVAAFLMNRFVPRKRRHMRSSALATLLYVGSFGAAQLFAFLGLAAPAHVARELTEFFGLVTVVHLGALVLIDVGLSAIGVQAAPFLASLGVVAGNSAAVVIGL